MSFAEMFAEYTPTSDVLVELEQKVLADCAYTTDEPYRYNEDEDNQAEMSEDDWYEAYIEAICFDIRDEPVNIKPSRLGTKKTRSMNHIKDSNVYRRVTQLAKMEKGV